MLCDFVAQCFAMDAAARPTAHALSEHRFIMTEARSSLLPPRQSSSLLLPPTPERGGGGGGRAADEDAEAEADVIAGAPPVARQSSMQQHLVFLDRKKSDPTAALTPCTRQRREQQAHGVLAGRTTSDTGLTTEFGNMMTPGE
jgi:hypothetical protein